MSCASTGVPVAAFHKRTVWSSLALAIVVPSGDHATSNTAPVCPTNGSLGTTGRELAGGLVVDGASTVGDELAVGRSATEAGDELTDGPSVGEGDDTAAVGELAD